MEAVGLLIKSGRYETHAGPFGGGGWRRGSGAGIEWGWCQRDPVKFVFFWSRKCEVATVGGLELEGGRRFGGWSENERASGSGGGMIWRRTRSHPGGGFQLQRQVELL